MSDQCRRCDKSTYQDGYCYHHLMRALYGVRDKCEWHNCDKSTHNDNAYCHHHLMMLWHGVRDDDKKKVPTVNVTTVNKSALPWEYKPYETCKPRNAMIVTECNRQQHMDKKIIVATIEKDGKFLCRACGAEFNIDAGTPLTSIECPRCHSYSVKHI